MKATGAPGLLSRNSPPPPTRSGDGVPGGSQRGPAHEAPVVGAAEVVEVPVRQQPLHPPLELRPPDKPGGNCPKNCASQWATAPSVLSLTWLMIVSAPNVLDPCFVRRALFILNRDFQFRRSTPCGHFIFTLSAPRGPKAAGGSLGSLRGGKQAGPRQARVEPHRPLPEPKQPPSGGLRGDRPHTMKVLHDK